MHLSSEESRHQAAVWAMQHVGDSIVPSSPFCPCTLAGASKTSVLYPSDEGFLQWAEAG